MMIMRLEIPKLWTLDIAHGFIKYMTKLVKNRERRGKANPKLGPTGGDSLNYIDCSGSNKMACGLVE